MFQYSEFNDHENAENSSIAHQPNSTIREKLRHILHSKPIHVSIIVLIILDTLIVILEMLIDMEAFTLEEGNPFPEILHGFSIAILSVFMVEIGLKIFADYKHFLSHKLEVVDGIVVVVSFSVDLALLFIEESEVLALLGLLVLFRLVRIINGIIVTTKSKADERIHKMKSKVKEVESLLEQTNEKIQSLSDENQRLRQVIEQHGINLAIGVSGVASVGLSQNDVMSASNA